MAGRKIASGLHAAAARPAGPFARYVGDKIRRAAIVMAGVGHATWAHTCALKSSRRKSKEPDFACIPAGVATRNARVRPSVAQFRNNPAPKWPTSRDIATYR